MDQQITVTLYIKNGKIVGVENQEDVIPGEVEGLYDRGQGVRILGTILYNPQPSDALAQTCCTYIWMGGKWVKVCQPC